MSCLIRMWSLRPHLHWVVMAQCFDSEVAFRNITENFLKHTSGNDPLELLKITCNMVFNVLDITEFRQFTVRYNTILLSVDFHEKERNILCNRVFLSICLAGWIVVPNPVGPFIMENRYNNVIMHSCICFVLTTTIIIANT